MATKNNFSLNQNYELSGHEVTILAVDFINTMASEVNDASDGTALGGIMLVRHAFAQEGVMILSEGPLTNSGTREKLFGKKRQLRHFINYYNDSGFAGEIKNTRPI